MVNATVQGDRLDSALGTLLSETARRELRLDRVEERGHLDLEPGRNRTGIGRFRHDLSRSDVLEV